MPKMKTHSGSKKRFRVTAKGKVKAKKAFSRHMMMNKPKSMKRKIRADGEKVLSWLPYARRKKNKPAVKKAAQPSKDGGK